MSKTKFIFILLFIIYSLSSFSQKKKDEFFYEIGQSLKSKPTFTFRFDNRNSFITNYRAWIYGVKIGLQFKDKFRAGLDFSMLHTGIYINQNIEYNGEIYNEISSKLHLEYASIFAEYVFYKTSKWEFTLPIQIGGGVSYFKYDLDNKTFTNNMAPVIMYEANITGQYKIIKGIGVGTGIGYRIMLLSNPKINQHFTSPVFSLKLILYPFDFISINKD